MKHCIFFMLVINSTGFAQTPINRKTWPTHPARMEIRKVVSEVDSLYETKQLRLISKSFEYEPYTPTLKEYVVDSSDKISRYHERKGSDDSVLDFYYYYDKDGKLRFVFIIGGAVNGSNLEHRIYFDSSGKRIWESHVYLKGPGYSFPEIWPDEDLVFKPKLD